MKSQSFASFDASRVPSPCFVVDEVAVEKNLKVLHHVQQESGAKILAALKAFSMWHLAPLVSKYLSGTCASGLHEALLSNEYYGGEIHVFSPGFKEWELLELVSFTQHVVLNSFRQWQRFRSLLQLAKERRPELEIGLRINPEHSEGTVAIYDPCAANSRLGIRVGEFREDLLEGITGLHFHTLCEQGFAPLQRTLRVVEEKFGQWLPSMKWVNFGGGHHITADSYNREGLIALIKDFSERYQVQVYLEPGEAIGINTGVLVAEVLDVKGNRVILDTSATCHMPDTLEMPYRPGIRRADEGQALAHSYHLGGVTCLAGDVIGEYSFAQPLRVGDRLVFDDMSHYTMVKTTTFNGVNLPSIALWNSQSDELKILKYFGYEDFKNRLS